MYSQRWASAGRTAGGLVATSGCIAVCREAGACAAAEQPRLSRHIALVGHTMGCGEREAEGCKPPPSEGAGQACWSHSGSARAGGVGLSLLSSRVTTSWAGAPGPPRLCWGGAMSGQASQDAERLPSCMGRPFELAPRERVDQAAAPAQPPWRQSTDAKPQAFMWPAHLACIRRGRIGQKPGRDTRAGLPRAHQLWQREAEHPHCNPPPPDT